jgi:hypothetical protein
LACEIQARDGFVIVIVMGIVRRCMISILANHHGGLGLRLLFLALWRDGGLL